MHLLVDFCQFIAALFVAPVLAYRSWRTGKYRTDWDQRRGFVPDLAPPAVDRARVWIHAVSVGEMNAVRGLIQAWQARAPQTEIVISCTTDTGIARARELFPNLLIVRYPLDFSRFIRRALDRIKPSVIVLVELEVWFNFVTLAAERGIPVAVVNGRLSEKSARMFSRIRPIARRMFSSLAWVGAQDEAYAARFRAVGVPSDRVTVTGSLKWETAQITDSIPGAADLADAMGIIVPGISSVSDSPARVWVCGSTGPGEEEILLKAYHRLQREDWGSSNIQLVIVPRKPERFSDVAQLIEQHGFACVRRSQRPDGQTRAFDVRAVHLVDTMGELRKVYSLADVVFVGRSLAPMGGSDMMEVAALGKPIIVGPHTENFRDAMQQLVDHRGVQVIAANDSKPEEATDTMVTAVAGILQNSEEARMLGDRAREVVRKNLGATGRTLDHLLQLVQRPASA